MSNDSPVNVIVEDEVLDKSAPIEINKSTLIAAIQYGDKELVENALEKNSFLFPFGSNTCDEDECSLLHWAAINNRLEIARYLIGKNANVNKIGGKNKEIPLQWAIRKSYCLRMLHLLISHGSDMNHKSMYGFDALHLACHEDNINATFLLLSMGANCNSTNAEGDTPLYWLIKNEHTANEVVNLMRLLLKFRANTLHSNKDQNTALHIVASFTDKRKADFYTAFMIYKNSHSAVFKIKNAKGFTIREIIHTNRNPSINRFFFDAWLYSLLPRSTPIISIALAFPTGFILVYYFHFLYGLLMLFALYMILFDKLMFPTIVTSDSAPACGYAWGTTISIVWSYYMFVSPQLEARSYYDVVIAVNAFAIMYTLYRSSATTTIALPCGDTSIESSQQLIEKMICREELIEEAVEHNAKVKIMNNHPDDEESSSSAASSSTSPLLMDYQHHHQGVSGYDSATPRHTVRIPEPFRLCTTCLTDKSLATMHCSRCDICVQSLDHHCPFVNNCVGKGNRRIFVLFTASAAIGCTLCSILSFYIQYHRDPVRLDAKEYHHLRWMISRILWIQNCELRHHAVFTLINYLCTMNALWIVCLCLGQLTMVAMETTTYEIMKRNNNGYFTFYGCIRNLIVFFLTGRYTTALVNPSNKTKSHHHHHHDHDHGHHAK